MVIAGWAVWTLLAGYTGSLWISKFTNPNGGVRLLAGRCAFLLTLLLVFGLVAPGSKLNLIWEAILVYVGSMMINGKLIDIRLKSAATRADAESKKTGESAEAILARELEHLGYGPEAAR